MKRLIQTSAILALILFASCSKDEGNFIAKKIWILGQGQPELSDSFKTDSSGEVNLVFESNEQFSRCFAIEGIIKKDLNEVKKFQSFNFSNLNIDLEKNENYIIEFRVIDSPLTNNACRGMGKLVIKFDY